MLVFFQTRQSHIFAQNCLTAAMRHDLETPLLCLFATFYKLFHLNQEFMAKLTKLGNAVTNL
jgi:hypothetical protein